MKSICVLTTLPTVLLNPVYILIKVAYTTYWQSTPYNTEMSVGVGENWLPYLIHYSQLTCNAFGDFYDEITSIYAEDWYAIKVNGVWWGVVTPGATGTLDYGKMYKVTFTKARYDFHFRDHARLEVKSSLENSAHIALYNLKGQLFKTITKAAKCMYLCKIKTDKKELTKKMIVID